MCLCVYLFIYLYGLPHTQASKIYALFFFCYYLFVFHTFFLIIHDILLVSYLIILLCFFIIVNCDVILNCDVGLVINVLISRDFIA